MAFIFTFTFTISNYLNVLIRSRTFGILTVIRQVTSEITLVVHSSLSNIDHLVANTTLLLLPSCPRWKNQSRYPAAVDMTLHYFQMDQLTPMQDKRLRAVFEEHPPVYKCASAGGYHAARMGDRGRFTPAVVEQLASEYDTIDDFIGALEARV